MKNLAVIFAGSPVDPYGQPEVPKAACYICADAGVALARALGVHPHWSVGDFDSLGSVPSGENVTVYPSEKDDTDIMLAAKYAMRRGFKTLLFYGALGGRLDHTVANLQLLRFLADHHVQGILVDEKHWITLQRGGTVRYPKRDFSFFSLLSLSEFCKDVTLEGVAYPLRHGTFSGKFPLGVSNAIIGKEAVVTVGEGDLLIIYAKD